MERYLASVEHRYVPRTLYGKRWYLEHLLRYCDEFDLRHPCEWTADRLRDFHRWTGETYPWGSVTRANAVQAVRSFLLWAYEVGETIVDFKECPLPKSFSPRPDIPTVALMRKLLSLPDTTTPLGQRDQILLELLYVLGLRARECLLLDVSDFNFQKMTVKVTGKGSHQRRVPLSPSVVRALQTYLNDGRRILLGRKSHEALLVSFYTRERIGPTTLGARVRKYSSPLGFKLRPHLLRHACASHLLEAGMSLPLVAELLGHKGIETSAYYTQISLHELHREYRRCHPRALPCGQQDGVGAS